MCGVSDVLEKTLGDLIEDAVRKLVAGQDDVAVAFSGGLDSSLVAMLAARHARRVTCFVAGVKGCRDFAAAEEAAGLLGLPLRKIEFRPTRRLAEEVACAIGSSERMQVEIAMPFFCLCRLLKEEEDRRVLLTGQGADELFLGYARYYRMSPAEAAARSLDDIRSVGDRDRLAAGASGVELRHPFLDAALVEHVLTLPASARAADPLLRKALLRRAAENLGLPRKIARRPKKALQYSSGSHAALRKIFGKG